jgi:hypothetical protein
MSGCLDPSRMTTFELEKPEVPAQVKVIALTDMEPDWDWDWDQEPYSRANPPPHVTWSGYFKLIRHSFFVDVYLTK